MRNYELVYIVHPDLDENSLKETNDRIKGWINGMGGTVVREDNWGKRRMAYAIRKQRDGHYVMFEMQLDPTNIAELERNLSLLEPIMRFMTVAK
ncbi:MAG: 30S ribosomal protein S6 [Anaerolineaceae bacterium]|nr:30S ribosomal protein S6 [Anaerolineaceae bacterium]